MHRIAYYIASVYVCNYIYIYIYYTHTSHETRVRYMIIYVYINTHMYMYALYLSTHVILLETCPSSGPELRCRVILPTVFQCQWWLLEPSDKLHVLVIPKKNQTDINMNYQSFNRDLPLIYLLILFWENCISQFACWSCLPVRFWVTINFRKTRSSGFPAFLWQIPIL